MAKISLRRVMSFYFVLFLATVLLVEGLSFLAFLLVEKEDGEGNLYSERLSQSVGMESGDSAATAPPLEVIHPYLGYVYNPEANNEALYKAHENLSISEFGFVDEVEPIQAQSNDKVVIGIFGGSVAWWLSDQGIDSLKNEIRRIPGFTDKELVIVRTALGGFKQPQPLMALSYLLTLGAHFDLVIEIDGVNEVALPPAENIPKNVFPVFPRNWYLRAQAVPHPAIQRMVGKITHLTSEQNRWAKLFSRTPLRHSYTLYFLWKYFDRNLAMEISETELALQGYQVEKSSYVAVGPSYQNESEVGLFEDLASIWKRSSLQMHTLCVANGIEYFHFLQPNQYVAGSKILREAELAQAVLANHPFRRGIERGYPYLIKGGQELVDAGVNFQDLTMLFSDNAEPLYIDTCCHLNRAGNGLLATAIGRSIALSYSQRAGKAERPR